MTTAPIPSLEFGYCPIDKGLLEEFRTAQSVVLPDGRVTDETKVFTYHACRCGYARLVSVESEKPWRR